MLALVMAVDQLGMTGGTPYNREEIAAFLRDRNVVQGRHSFEKHGPLPGCNNVVLASAPIDAPDVVTLHSPAEIVAISREVDLHVIGGTRMFKTFLPLADRVYLTKFFIACPGASAPILDDFRQWIIDDVRHHGIFSHYTLLRRDALCS